NGNVMGHYVCAPTGFQGGTPLGGLWMGPAIRRLFFNLPVPKTVRIFDRGRRVSCEERSLGATNGLGRDRAGPKIRRGIYPEVGEGGVAGGHPDHGPGTPADPARVFGKPGCGMAVMHS